MGYDMYSQQAPPTEGEGDGQSLYFRLNIWGMSWMCGIMERLDLLAFQPYPEWPDRPADEHFDDQDEPITEIGKVYAAAQEAARASVSEHGPIPAFKFGSNDGWLITPDECRLLAQLKDVTAETYAQLDPGEDSPDEGLQLVHRFGEFAANCVDLGGFRVW